MDAAAVAMTTPSPSSLLGLHWISRCRLNWSCNGVDRHLPAGVFILPTRPRQPSIVDGAIAAATGAITGAVVLLAARAITDLPTAIIALVSLSVLFGTQSSRTILMRISEQVGLALWLCCGGRKSIPRGTMFRRRPYPISLQTGTSDR